MPKQSKILACPWLLIVDALEVAPTHSTPTVRVTNDDFCIMQSCSDEFDEIIQVFHSSLQRKVCDRKQEGMHVCT